MDAGQLLDGLSWQWLPTAAVSVYALSIAVFLILENRSPQSTFAWLFLLLVFPIGGLLIYAMFGRNRHVFSRERSLMKLIEGTTLADRAAATLAGHQANVVKLDAIHGECAQLASMLWASARAPLTLGNDVEILQNAAEKYPRLLADIRAATR